MSCEKSAPVGSVSGPLWRLMSAQRGLFVLCENLPPVEGFKSLDEMSGSFELANLHIIQFAQNSAKGEGGEGCRPESGKRKSVWVNGFGVTGEKKWRSVS